MLQRQLILKASASFGFPHAIRTNDFSSVGAFRLAWFNGMHAT